MLHGSKDAIAERRTEHGEIGRIALLVLLCFIIAQTAEAGAVRAEVVPIATRTRSNAPSLVEVKLSVAGGGLVQGRLELELARFSAIAATVRSQEIVVPASGLSLRMILPPLPGDGEVTVTARMLTERGSIPAGESHLWSVPGGGPNFLTAVVGARSSRGEGHVRLWQELRLERFADPNETRLASWSTTPAFFDPADLPESALSWCAFNLVLLEGDSFARLRSRQLAALVQWVEGGGSVFITGTGNLSPDHLRALNRLVPHPPGGRDRERDSAGKLVPLAHAVILSRPELGRCVLAPAPAEQGVDFAPAEWREATAFLWKVNATTMEQIRLGAFRLSANPSRSDYPGMWENLIAQRLHALFPRTVRTLPVGLVAGILAGFAFAVGPGEWFVLGWLRMRRWTWLVFPLSAVAFTSATMLAANHYLGRRDHRATIVISDIGRGGRVLRESRFEMLMAGENQTHRAELTRTLKVPTTLGSRVSYSDSARSEPPLYDGQHPLRFTFSQQLKQWEPRVFRTFTFDAAPSADGIDWDAVDAGALGATRNPATLFTDRCHAKGFGIRVFHRGRLEGATTGPSDSSDASDFIRYLCAREIGPLGKILSTISPSGDAQGADLAFHDPGQLNEWAVVVISEQKNTLHIRRRIYRSDE